MKLFSYHLLLAAKSLRRDAGLSLLMLAALALGGGIWSFAICQYTRFHGYEFRLRSTLYQLEVLRPRDANAVFAETAGDNPYMAPAAIKARTHLSYPEYRLAVQSRAPAGHSVGIRAELLVRGGSDDGNGAPAQVRVARFTDVAFFSMFQRPFAAGGPWDAAEDGATPASASGPGVAVLGLASGRALFPRGDAVGKTIWIEGRPFRVVGVLSAHQPLNAPWHLHLIGGVEDALFLPVAEFDRLGVRPEEPLFRSPVAHDRPALLASDALFVNLWAELPTAVHRANYRRDLDRLLGADRYVLRSLPEWRREFAMPASQIAFFGFMGVVVLLGGGFNLSRWLMAKGLLRGGEMGVFRALGAPRASLFWRITTEAVLLALPAALMAPLFALPMVWLFNRHVHVVDMPLQMGTVAIALSIIGPFIVCLLGAMYPAWRLARTPPTIYLGRP